MTELSCSLSTALKAKYADFLFGLIIARRVDSSQLAASLDAVRKPWFKQLRNEVDLVKSRVDGTAAFFQANGFECPLPSQLQRTLAGGLPRISPHVDALLITEMTTGTLMGAQDLSSIEGALLIDVAQDGETFDGFRTTVTCRADEVVIRDEATIIASYFQGPDKKTALTPSTTSLAFFVFYTPGASTDAPAAAQERIASLLSDAGADVSSRTVPG